MVWLSLVIIRRIPGYNPSDSGFCTSWTEKAIMALLYVFAVETILGKLPVVSALVPVGDLEQCRMVCAHNSTERSPTVRQTPETAVWCGMSVGWSREQWFTHSSKWTHGCQAIEHAAALARWCTHLQTYNNHNNYHNQSNQNDSNLDQIISFQSDRFQISKKIIIK